MMQPKKEIKLWLIWFTMLFTLLFLVSCGSSKKISNKNSVTKETFEKTKDSTSNVQTNLPITDRIVVNVPKSDNAEVMRMFDALLQRLNTSKSSGSNSYNLRYDEELRQLIADIKVAQTQNTQTTSDTKIEKSFEEQTDAYLSRKVKGIPWWIWVGVIVWFLPQIVSRLRLLINPLSTFFQNKN